jgi:hypothetical protein
MRSVVLTLTVAMLLLPLGQGRGQQVNQTFSLTIVVAKSNLTSGEELKVTTTLRNNSDRKVTLMDTRRDCDYPVQVTYASGEPAPLTDYGRRLNCSVGTGFSRNIQITLKPGESAHDEIVVTNTREMTRPGKYWVAVWREIPKTFGPDPIKSNTIAITVTK